ncbi:hypothetical protein M0R45_022224 [Rubus argutus]|uniref:Uncharacterized protein n=1 Tax=Rubus argutus TaxID=59490 RepID=A0AAW1XFD6_RUBAR
MCVDQSRFTTRAQTPPCSIRPPGCSLTAQPAPHRRRFSLYNQRRVSSPPLPRRRDHRVLCPVCSCYAVAPLTTAQIAALRRTTVHPAQSSSSSHDAVDFARAQPSPCSAADIPSPPLAASRFQFCRCLPMLSSL